MSTSGCIHGADDSPFGVPAGVDVPGAGEEDDVVAEPCELAEALGDVLGERHDSEGVLPAREDIGIAAEAGDDQVADAPRRRRSSRERLPLRRQVPVHQRERAPREQRQTSVRVPVCTQGVQ